MKKESTHRVIVQHVAKDFNRVTTAIKEKYLERSELDCNKVKDKIKDEESPNYQAENVQKVDLNLTGTAEQFTKYD